MPKSELDSFEHAHMLNLDIVSHPDELFLCELCELCEAASR